jgi:ketosteroid isomerase-like protein
VTGAASVESNKALLRRVLAAYERGDYEPIFEALDDEVVWSSNSLANHYRFGGTRRGRAGVVEALSMIAADYQISRYDVHEMIGEGDVIWASSELSLFDRRTHRPLVFPLVNRWTFRNGKIVSCGEFFDTAAVLQQQGRIPSELPREVKA